MNTDGSNMRECYIVVHCNYAEGTDAYAFYSKEDAKKSVKEDVETEVKSLEEEGYCPKTLWGEDGSAEVYVPDSDIFYEWSIIMSNIR